MSDPPGRVTLVAPTWPPMRCGIAPYSRNLAECLRESGLEVVVVTDCAAGIEPGLSLVRMRDWSLTAVLRLAGRLRATKPHIIHLQHPTRASRVRPAVYLLPLLLRLVAPRHRVVTTFHYVRPVEIRTALLRAFFLVPALASHAIVVTTEWEARYARHILPGKPVHVAPAGLSFDMARSTDGERIAERRRLGLSAADFLVVYFGYLLPNKGLETLLRAVMRTGESAKLLVIGGSYETSDAYVDGLRGLAYDLGVSDRVIWAGTVAEADVARLMSAADCAALPFHEGASLKRSTLLAALQIGLPVVTTTGPEIDSAMRDGDNLILVRPRDVVGLTAALGRLRADPALRAGLSARGREILRLTAWDTIVETHQRLYQRLSLGWPGRQP